MNKTLKDFAEYCKTLKTVSEVHIKKYSVVIISEKAQELKKWFIDYECNGRKGGFCLYYVFVSFKFYCIGNKLMIVDRDLYIDAKAKQKRIIESMFLMKNRNLIHNL